MWNVLQGQRWKVLFDAVVGLRDIDLCKGVRESERSADEHIAAFEQHCANPRVNEIAVGVNRDEAGNGEVTIVETKDYAVVVEMQLNVPT